MLVQAQLNHLGFDAGPVDGIWGKKTSLAYERFKQDPRRINHPAVSSVSKTAVGQGVIAPLEKKFDQRSERNIATLNPKAQTASRQWLAAVRAASIPAVIIEGTRTFARQKELYDQGRSKPGKIVTNSRPGTSKHNFGAAWDFVVFEGVNDQGGVGSPLWSSPLMLTAGKLAKSQGLRWGALVSKGGDFRSLDDVPHIELSDSLASLAAQYPGGYSA
jgi:peptidoglycan L-alanyl-D-glutamate endopeptidase CwlK